MTDAQVVDLSEYHAEPQCEMGCGNAGTVIARGCMDKHPVTMCDACLKRGLDVIWKYVQLYQRLNKRILVCGDCHRPVLRLDTHIDVREL